MKLLCFADMHGSEKAYRKLKEKTMTHKPDALVCAGDISFFEHDIDKIAEKLASLKKEVYLVHGNHESEQKVKRLCSRHENLIFCHKKFVEKEGITFFGYGGEGFRKRISDFEHFVKKNKKILDNAKKIFFITHQPPHKTRLDELWGDYVGAESFTKFVKSRNQQIAALVCGHIHENSRKTDSIKGVRCLNPGPYGKIMTVR